MKRYEAKTAAYHETLDILYVGEGIGECCRIEDTPSGITVMYDDDGLFSGAEISLFSTRAKGFPAVINVDANEPFELAVLDATTFPRK